MLKQRLQSFRITKQSTQFKVILGEGRSVLDLLISYEFSIVTFNIDRSYENEEQRILLSFCEEKCVTALSRWERDLSSNGIFRKKYFLK